MPRHHEEPFDRFQQYYIPQEEITMTTSETFRKFIWNHKEKEFCGRDAASWCKYSNFTSIFNFDNSYLRSSDYYNSDYNFSC